MENSLNMLEMFAKLSQTLESKNPNLKNIVNKGLNNELGTAKDIEKFLIKSFPNKKKEIQKQLKNSNLENQLTELKSKLNDLSKFNSFNL